VPWPAGWLVLDEARWVPIVLELDQHIYRAREDFLRGDRAATKAELERAGVWLTDQQKRVVQGRRSEEYTKARSALQALASKLSTSAPIGSREFDDALRQGYPPDVFQWWAEDEEQAVIPYLIRPVPHFARARELLAKKDMEAAAFEVRRGADWIALLARSKMKDEDRDTFHEIEAQLRAAAEDIAGGKDSAKTELDKALASADRAYELYFLHWAERVKREQKLAQLEQPFNALADRIEQAARGAGRELDAAEAKLTTQLHALANKVKVGDKRLEGETKRLLHDARDYLEHPHTT
jgi:hypothetical protein